MADVAKFKSLGASAADLATAWQDRLADANALLAAGRHASAIAFGVYTLEVVLKTRICRVLNLGQLPRIFEIHDLVGLATAAGLRSRIDDSAFLNSNIGQNWALVSLASQKLEDYRYKPDSGWSKQDAADILNCLQDPTDGVIPWIQKQP
jgi:hypothetical protein